MENEIIKAMKDAGLKMYMWKGSDSYAYVTDGEGIAYVQWSDRAGVSTVHVPNTQTGTGFQFSSEITPELVKTAMTVTAPHWATYLDVCSVVKYKDWQQFHTANAWNKQLREVS